MYKYIYFANKWNKEELKSSQLSETENKVNICTEKEGDNSQADMMTSLSLPTCWDLRY
jgi:hypothetical protein